MKKTNKKFIIAIVALAMVVCLAVGGLIGVLAAGSQQVKSTFNVQYNIGENIAGKISAKYAVATDAAVDFVTGAEDDSETAGIDESKVIAFNTTTEEHGTADVTAYALDAEAEEISLSPSKTYVVFTYTFENNGATNFKVTLIDSCAKANVKVAYAVSDNDETTTDEEMSATAGFTVAAGKVANVTITVTVDDTTRAEANYTSAEGAGLVWNLAYVA